MCLNFNQRFELCAIQSNSNCNHSKLLRKPFTSDSIQQISMFSASFHEICFHLKLSHASTSCGVQSSEVIFDENVDQCQIAQLLNKAGGRSPRELFGDLKCCLTGRTKN